MKNKPEQAAEVDAELFRKSLQDVVPLAPSDRRIKPASPTRRIAHNLPLPSTPVSDVLSDHGAPEIPLTEYLSNGLNRMTLRKLRRGEWPPQESLDLHGLTTDAARKLLMEFLQYTTSNGLRCVNVIHGKGWRSEGREGTLKIHTRHWLTQHPQVLAFCEAPPNAGGGGAVLVLLKALGLK
jgi:DNA-nicking Smr family endonuclease